MLYDHHASVCTAWGSDQNAWVSFGKQRWVSSRERRSEAFQDTEELTKFAALASFLGKGESACLALAQQRGWWVASDEGGAFRREAQQRLGPGRLINTLGFLLSAIRAGVLTVEEADHAKAVLEQHRFRVKFKSFRGLLQE
jgi:predicted nucleic acid-binding protein